MTANGTGGIYAPLKQLISDSESEEDHKVLDDVHNKSPDSCNNVDYNTGLQSSKNYSLSDMDDYNTNVNTTIESTMDNVSFLESDMSNKMSFPRRCVFIASILLCVFTVVIFLWGIPCSDTGACAGREWQDRTTSWELPYEEIELSGTVQVVDGALVNTKNLIFIYRGNHMRRSGTEKNNVNGVLLIVGNSGKVGWYTRESRIPTEINCHMIDVNQDNQKDCIVSGSDGLLAALHPLSGTYYWYIHKRGKIFSNVINIDFPIALLDIDADKVKDLLTVATISPSNNHNSLILISGATGKIFGEPITVEDCVSVKLVSDSEAVTYLCKNGTFEAVRSITYPDLFRRLLKLDSSSPLHTHIKTGVAIKVNQTLKKNIGNTRDIFSNGPGKLTVENSGECPDNCKVYLKLTLERNGTVNTTWEYAAHHVFAMRPSSFAFANSIRGFVLKL